MSEGSLVVSIIGIAITTLGLAGAGLWAYNKSVKEQFDEMDKKATKGFETVFRRMDENHMECYKEFVKRELYEAEIRHQEERNNDKFISIRQVFETMFNNLGEKIDALSEKLRENGHNNGGKIS